MLLKKIFKKESLNIEKNNVPQHIAIIMDGNGRWAKKRGLPRSIGHKEGAKALERIAGYCGEIGIKHLTVYAFSTENWKRPQEEVDSLMNLLLEYLKNAEMHIKDKNTRIRILGDTKRLSSEIQNEIVRVEKVTEKNSGLSLNFALNYGSQDEIISATKLIAQRVLDEKITLDDISKEEIEKNLYTSGIPEPDLLIRPGGEKRLSNYLLWQCAYTELWFTDILWPDFTKNHIKQAIVEYQKRIRKYGGI